MARPCSGPRSENRVCGVDPGVNGISCRGVESAFPEGVDCRLQILLGLAGELLRFAQGDGSEPALGPLSCDQHLTLKENDFVPIDVAPERSLAEVEAPPFVDSDLEDVDP